MDSNNTTIHCWVPWRRTGTNNKSEEEGDDEEEEDDDDEEACGGIGSVPENNKRKKKTKKKKKPALMLLHGFAPNALLCWENQIAAFVRDFDVYVPDLLFFGNSTTTQQREEQGEEKQRQRWSEAFQAECLMHMLQVLGVQQKQKKKKNNSSSQQQQQQELHVLGTSYGGMVAFRMAELYPTLVSKVVFSSSGICMSPTNNDELLARNNLSHVSQMLLPSTVQQMRVGVATAIYKQNRIPDFLLRDFVEVSAMDGSSCMLPIPAKPNPPSPPTQSPSLVLTNFFQVLIFAQLLLEREKESISRVLLQGFECSFFLYPIQTIVSVLLMMVMKVLYEENRAERKQLLDDMVIGTPEAFPLPQLTQVKAFHHTTQGQASSPPLPCLQPLGPSSSSSLCSSQQLVVPEFTCQCLKTEFCRTNFVANAGNKNSAECTCYQCLKTKILQNALVANAQTRYSALVVA
jgi:pimeloyl-ACP methyl ester carboxylesterase